MPLLDNNPTGGIFEYQAPATLNQATPVNGTWYEIGGTGYWATKKHVRIYGISVNIEDANEDIEVQITIDGETIAALATTCTHSTNYYCRLYPDAIDRVDEIDMDSSAVWTTYKSFVVEGKSVKIEVRKTSANGAGNLTAIVIYGML